MDDREVKKLFERIKTKYKFDYDLKEEQIKALGHLLNGENVAIVASTGFGKTDVFTLFPLMMDIYKPLNHGNHITMVISPLTALVEDTCHNLRAKGVSAVILKKKTDVTKDELKDILHGKYSVVIMTPEALLNVEFWRGNVLHNEVYDQRATLIALDEAHIISKWGKSFRTAYTALDEVRSCLTNAKVLLATATLTKGGLEECLKSLQLSLAEVRIIAKQSDRPNIFIGYKSESKMDLMTEINWYIQRLKKDGRKAAKCILYVSNLTQAGIAYGEIMHELGNSAYCGEPNITTRMVFEYHGESEDVDQKTVIKGFCQPDGPIRLVIATIAFGMGVNIPNIRYIIHWGPPDSILDYWQELGRAGRDGNPAFGFFYAIRVLIAHSSEPMRTFIKGIRSGQITCVRTYVLKSLQLPEMDKNYITELEGRTACSNPENCSKLKDCSCLLCCCCSLCQARCLCEFKQKANKLQWKPQGTAQ